ncbi:DUF416 family protein [Daejeonella oryzae]|uniref:DUF416 family protein n=1 Tax=Daejeonella oryzae TaxID=1122943 RepID=UPI000478E2CE|nr:DUF416 family protein [Daejeonella oryzae]
MTVSEFTPILTRQINGLTNEQAVDFGLNICRRLLPEYIDFSQRNNWGDPDTLEDSIKFCIQNKTFQNVQFDKAKEFHEAVGLVIPDMDDFGDLDSSYALNASCAVLELLEFFLDGDKTHVLNISTYMTDTVDFKISETEPELTNEELDNHEKIVKELKYQLDLLKNNVA